MSFFRYIINFWDEVAEKEVKTAGLVVGSNFVEVGAALDEYYGDSIIKVLLYPVEDNKVYEFDVNNSDSNLFTLQVNYTEGRRNG